MSAVITLIKLSLEEIEVKKPHIKRPFTDLSSNPNTYFGYKTF